MNTHQNLNLTWLSMFIVIFHQLFRVLLIPGNFYLPSHNAYSYETSLVLLYREKSEEISVRNRFYQKKYQLFAYNLKIIQNMYSLT